MKNLKTLYVFDIPRTHEIEEWTEETTDKGEKRKVSQKVKKETLTKAALMKPTRAFTDEAEVYYSALVGKGIMAGLLSRAMLAKRFSNDGGIWSEPDKKKYADTFFEYDQKFREQVRLSSIPNPTGDDKKQIEILTKEIAILQRDLQNFELNQMSLYDVTAESRARTKTILWWLLHLTYMVTAEADKPEDVEWEPVFKGETFEERLAEFDRIGEGEGFSEEDKDFYFRLIRRAMAATAYWFYGRATSQKDFEGLEKELENPQN